MKVYPVSFRPAAEADLRGIYEYVAQKSGDAVAGRYIERIEACLALEHFPRRGRAWDDVRAGLRTIGFERRITIAFVVSDAEVTIARILYGGRDYESLLSGAADE